MSESLPFFTRLWFAFVCLFRVLVDARFAARAFAARTSEAALPAAREPIAAPKREPKPKPLEGPDVGPALQLLALLQREGRLVDFIEQDVTGFSDADIGAAARVVHQGCRKALHAHAEITPVMSVAEGGSVTLEDGFDAASVKLTGNVSGSPPYKGILRHKGWRAKKLELPLAVEGHDARVLAPAEVEL